MIELDFLLAVIANTKMVGRQHPDLAEGNHFETLLGERPAGSKWGQADQMGYFHLKEDGGFQELHFEILSWEEFTPAEGIAMKGCRYFRTDISEFFPQAMNAACTIEELPDGTEIRVIKGAHGWELVADMEPVSTSVATLIIGPHEGSDIIFTVHPGEPMKTGKLDGATVKLG